MKPADIIEILQHFQSGNPVESRPRGSAEEYKADPEPIWDFAGREYRKAPLKPETLWRNPVNGFVWDGTGFHPETEQLQEWDKYVLLSKTPSVTICNPENIDFKKHPIPKGYRVVTARELGSVMKTPECWMIFQHAFNRWMKLGRNDTIKDHWTYLCPIDWRPS